MLLNPLPEDVTQTEKETVEDAATNFTKVLLFKPKQDALSRAVHDFFVVAVVLPQAPLKSQMGEALAQSEVDGIFVEQAGSAGGWGAGAPEKVSDQLTTLPVEAGFLLSTIQSDQVPFAFCPLFTAPR